MTPVNQCGVAYKFKAKDGWTQLLSFVAEKNGHWFFKPYEDTESTEEVHMIHLFVAKAGAPLKEFHLCKFYGTWEKAPHVCGKDCPL